MNCSILLCEISNWNWDGISALASILLAIVAFLTLSEQRRQFKKLRDDEYERAFKNSSITLITDFDKQFRELDDDRYAVAAFILKNQILEQTTFEYSLIENSIGEIFDFFDTIGYFVIKEYIKPEVVHQYFSYWFFNYYEFYKIYYVKDLSEYDKTVWINIPKLYKKMEMIEHEQSGNPQSKPITKTDLIKFFKEEAWEDKMP